MKTIGLPANLCTSCNFETDLLTTFASNVPGVSLYLCEVCANTEAGYLLSMNRDNAQTRSILGAQSYATNMILQQMHQLAHDAYHRFSVEQHATLYTVKAALETQRQLLLTLVRKCGCKDAATLSDALELQMEDMDHTVMDSCLEKAMAKTSRMTAPVIHR